MKCPQKVRHFWGSVQEAGFAFSNYTYAMALSYSLLLNNFQTIHFTIMNQFYQVDTRRK
jgi:hypothetical protein